MFNVKLARGWIMKEKDLFKLLYPSYGCSGCFFCIFNPRVNEFRI